MDSLLHRLMCPLSLCRLGVSLAVGLTGCNFSEALQGCRESGRCPADTTDLVPGSTYALSGSVSGATQGGVIIGLEGVSPEWARSTMTDAMGHYVFAGIASGTFKVTPLATGYVFAPTERANVTVDDADVGGQDFVATTIATTPPAAISLVSGDGQRALYWAALGQPLVVRVTDVAGNPLRGASVSWVASTGGHLSAEVTTTNDAGEASAIATLGSAVGPYTFEAWAGGLPGPPVTFSATAVAGPASALHYVSGNHQRAAVGTRLSSPFVVQVTDVRGNGVVNYSVTWKWDGDGGPLATATDHDGLVSVDAKMGSSPGEVTFLADADELEGSPIVFTATATVGEAANLTYVSGDNQVGAPNGTLALPLVVKVTDPYGNPVPNFPVTWDSTWGKTVPSSGVRTDTAGVASVHASLGSCAHTYTFEAWASGMAYPGSSEVTFTATCVAPDGG